MTEAPKLKVGDQLFALRSRDLWEPMPAVVKWVGRKYATILVQTRYHTIEGRVDMTDMEFVGRWSPANYLYHSEEEWDVQAKARRDRAEANAVWHLLKKNWLWNCPETVTAADIREAARLLGVDLNA